MTRPLTVSEVAERLLGEVLCSHYGAVGLWVGTSGRRLMGFSVEHVDRIDALMDDMARLDEKMGLR